MREGFGGKKKKRKENEDERKERNERMKEEIYFGCQNIIQTFNLIKISFKF